jgi:hypothetical protein
MRFLSADKTDRLGKFSWSGTSSMHPGGWTATGSPVTHLIMYPDNRLTPFSILYKIQIARLPRQIEAIYHYVMANRFDFFWQMT